MDLYREYFGPVTKPPISDFKKNRVFTLTTPPFTSESLIPPFTSPSQSRRRRHITGEAYRLVVCLRRLFSNLFASSTENTEFGLDTHHIHGHSVSLSPSNPIWESPRTPKEAEKRLAQLRRDYAKQVKETRKGYIHEMELLRLDKLQKDQAKQEAFRVAKEERTRLKAEAAKVRAQERKLAEEEFRQTLLKERAEKLENWRMKEKRREENKEEKNKLLRRKTSVWIEEEEMEKKILEALIDSSPL
ncbi:hypothetical protein Q3G72_024764 [Acer saccharum]|nr:hypothetical protein Q3G72_024764 [Acer saccharum]